MAGARSQIAPFSVALSAVVAARSHAVMAAQFVRTIALRHRTPQAHHIDSTAGHGIHGLFSFLEPACRHHRHTGFCLCASRKFNEIRSRACAVRGRALAPAK